MRNFGFVGATVAASLAVSMLVPSSGSAHINPLVLKSRGGDQKMSPCDGATWGSGGVYTFQPGATVTLGLAEAIAHDSYYRIAFDKDATASFEDPATIDPYNANRVATGEKCLKGDPNDKCGTSDFCTRFPEASGVTVLWDRLDRHIPAVPLLPGPNFTWTIKLPDIECEKCTIQLSQVMEDSAFHGAYCPTGKCPGDTSAPDIYHRCIDVTLKKGATNSPGATPMRTEIDGIDCSKAATNDAGVVMIPDASVGAPPSSSTVDGGSTGTGSTGTGSTGTGSTSTPAGTADASTTGAGNSLDNTDNSSSDDGGCSVRANASSQSGLMALFALASVLVWRRRRARG